MIDRIRFEVPLLLVAVMFAASAHALSQGPNLATFEAACTFDVCTGSTGPGCSIGDMAGEFVVVTDFGFNLPPSTTSIDGYLVEVKAFSDTGCSPTVQLQAPALVGSSRSVAATPVSNLCTASEFRSAGGAADNFGATLAAADVNDFGFGVRVNRCSVLGVDAVRMTVFFTIGTPVCGDGFQTGGEPCDDGNTDRGDGCSAECQIEHGLDADAQDCVNRTNKNGVKVLTAVGKLASSCVKATSKGDEPDPDACLAADAKGAVAKAAAKLAADDAAHCTDGAAFGYTSAPTATASMDLGMRAIVHDVFGPTLTGVVGTGPAGVCQDAVLKSLQKIVKAKTKLFLKCKKDGLKGKPFVQLSGADLEGCFDPLADDVQGKIAKAVLGLQTTVEKKCVAVPFGAAFPGPCGSSGDAASLATCVDRQIECRTCQLFNGADGITRDCDAFDDGSVNGSCS